MAGLTKSDSIYTFQGGCLRIGDQTLALPIAESWRLSVRVALAVLYDYFAGEPQAERKAYALHYRLSQYISSVSEGWYLLPSDLDELVALILCDAHGHEKIGVEILSAQRRDQIRQLATSNN